MGGIKGVGTFEQMLGGGRGQRVPLSLSLVFVTKPLQLLSFAPPKTDYLGKAGSSAHHIDSVDGFDLLPLLGFNMEGLPGGIYKSLP